MFERKQISADMLLTAVRLGLSALLPSAYVERGMLFVDTHVVRR